MFWGIFRSTGSRAALAISGKGQHDAGGLGQGLVREEVQGVETVVDVRRTLVAEPGEVTPGMPLSAKGMESLE